MKVLISDFPGEQSYLKFHAVDHPHGELRDEDVVGRTILAIGKRFPTSRSSTLEIELSEKPNPEVYQPTAAEAYEGYRVAKRIQTKMELPVWKELSQDEQLIWHAVAIAAARKFDEIKHPSDIYQPMAQLGYEGYVQARRVMTGIEPPPWSSLSKDEQTVWHGVAIAMARKFDDEVTHKA